MTQSIDPTPRQTFSGLAREHHRMALLYARTLTGEEHTARDLAQDAFLLAWQNWAKFDITRDFASWLRGIIRNKWREHCRKNSRVSHWNEEALSELENTMQSMPETGFFDELKDCLDKLPETLLSPVLSYYYQSLSTAETAEQLNTSEAATRKRLQRARTALKTCLTQKTSNAQD
ncbi:MAG: sigma-70 family RNA polymerase sigma factor [Akkermansiaceae bacterium]|nr:sigma-70 family RNA polymerase sigma factor [Akkermansiaceae bacterium]